MAPMMRTPWMMVLLASVVAAACGDDDSPSRPDAARADATPLDATPADATPADAAPACTVASPDATATRCGAGPTSNIEHLVVIIQENHSFDSYFGRYCTATPGSNPTCNDGPACCEAGPDKTPGSDVPPTTLDDATNGAFDPNHYFDCNVDEINGGKMDRFIEGLAQGAHDTSRKRVACGNRGDFLRAFDLVAFLR